MTDVTQIDPIDLDAIAPNSLYPPLRVAALLHLRPKTLANLRVMGRGPRVTKVGAHPYYLGRDLIDYLIGTSSDQSSRHQRRASEISEWLDQRIKQPAAAQASPE
jgi:hypothetical protein